MKSLRLIKAAPAPQLSEQEVPRPVPRKGEVLIRVYAAGITPTELAWSTTTHTKDGAERIGAVPGHEFSGEIAALGEGVDALRIGQPVYGMNDWFEDGALEGYCLTQPASIAPKPTTLGHTEAASVPIAALTAWQGLFDRAQLQPGERVLVHGGAGAVGVFAIQLARWRGAHVLTTVSARNVDFVKSLGADEAIDYAATAFENIARNIDVVFDGVGGQTLQRSWQVLRPGGRLVTIAADGEGTPDQRVKQAFFIVEPRREQLIEVGRLVDAGILRPIVDTVVPFARAADAYVGTVIRSGRGKIVVTVADNTL
jgi:NADPH:quinone reductase-like Zn-dependent oxidoreductase